MLRNVHSALARWKALSIALKALSVFIVAAALFGAYYLAAGRAGHGDHSYVVEVLDEGFSPAEITILAGDTVTFVNKTKSGAWPASDPHPTHTFLSGFDPKQSIAPGAEWSYTFAEAGDWQYHDHLVVTFHGKIHVLAKNKESVVEKSTKGGYCDGKCFDDLIRSAVQTKGIDAAYALFQETYDSGNLPRGCHWTAHQIGEEAYHLFKEGKDFKITDATSYCAYGFYHGFMEGLLRENPDPAYALSFCDKVKEKLGSMGLQNCYHGIGHGYTEDPPDPAVEGDFDAMIKPGIKMCEFLFGGNFRDLNLCLTGVYTVPAGFASEGLYGLKMDPADPFEYCKDQPERYWKACYGEFVPKLDKITNGDIDKVVKYVDSLKDDRLKRLAVWVFPSVTMARDVMKPEHDDYINKCRKDFSGRYRLICWGGTILGFFSQGKPMEQYKQVLQFCSSAAWQTEDERRFCWGEGFRQMRQTYSIDKVKSICPSAPSKYQSLCLDEKSEHASPYDDPSF